MLANKALSRLRRLFHPPDRRRPLSIFPNVALATSLHCWLAQDMQNWQEPDPVPAPLTIQLEQPTITMDTVILEAI
jgi:hypothetical protein